MWQQAPKVLSKTVGSICSESSEIAAQCAHASASFFLERKLKMTSRQVEVLIKPLTKKYALHEQLANNVLRSTTSTH